MKISLLHPSRGRAEQAHKTFMHWLLCSSLQTHIEHVLSVDEDDAELSKYDLLFTKSVMVVNPNKNLVEAANHAANVCTGDIIVLMSDDMLCPNNWDIILKEIHAEHKNYLLKTFDGVQKWIVTLPIMDRAFYEENGYIYHPDYTHMFCDTDLTHKADLENKLIMRNDIEFTHAHYSTGAREKDAVNTKADSTWKQGEEVYLRRCNEFFNKWAWIDLFNLKKEAIHHSNWLKNKLA